ncbi:SDR family oxidoreductase [Amycolatopsis sp. NPDC023774]
MAGGSLGALVNAGLEGFVRNAAAELPRGLRINVVSPGWVAETLAALGITDAVGTSAAEVARWYVGCVSGTGSGQTITG